MHFLMSNKAAVDKFDRYTRPSEGLKIWRGDLCLGPKFWEKAAVRAGPKSRDDMTVIKVLQ